MTPTPLPEQPVLVRLDLKVPMRDGVELSTDLYRPAEGERFPVLLLRTYHDNQSAGYIDMAGRFARAGYAVALQDTRGRYDSDGTWQPYMFEMDDGHDTIEWLGQQPWCDGNVGTFGHSYNGFTAARPAPLHSQYLKAVVSQAGQEDNFFGHCFNGGALELWNDMNFLNLGRRTLQFASRRYIDFDKLFLHLPLITALDDIVDQPNYRNFFLHPTFDEFWSKPSLKGRYPEIEAPGMFITGWYDNLMHEGFKLFRGWSSEAGTPEARSRTKLLVGPWTHDSIGTAKPFGDIEFGPSAAFDVVGHQLRWFDQRLKGSANGIDDEAPLRLFVMGRNVWRDEYEWPLARTVWTPYYFSSGGQANSLHGDGVLSTERSVTPTPDTFTYDPEHPVPTHGGSIQPMWISGPRDRSAIEERDDVLVYTSEPLSEELEVTGPIELVLYAASSAPDTDFTASLVDVHPDGKAIILCEGIIRARYRDSRDQPRLIDPGQIYQYRLSLWETSNVFLRGHRIRVEVTSSNFPRHDRNLNTGHPIGMDAEMQPAVQTIYHDAQHASHIILPVIPQEV